MRDLRETDGCFYAVMDLADDELNDPLKWTRSMHGVFALDRIRYHRDETAFVISPRIRRKSNAIISSAGLDFCDKRALRLVMENAFRTLLGV